MRKCLSFLLVATAVAGGITIWAIIFSLVAWAIVFLTGALHNSGLDWIPSLPFWQSVVVFSFIIYLLQARSNK